MKTLRPQKRSVSPFGLVPVAADDPFHLFRSAINAAFPEGETSPGPLKIIEDARRLPAIIEKIWTAPANDAPELDALCQFLLRFRESLDKKNLSVSIYETMVQLFDRKTELFMIDHQDKEHCQKMGWPEEYRDVVLFAKERDALVGRYVAPLTETQPGVFSAFITRWIESENPDRVLHFLDFCSGSKNPTFEHYLLFSHPALARVLSNKANVRALFERTKPVLAKLTSPTWEKDVRAALGV